MNRRPDGSRIRSIREARGESLPQVAARAYCDPETLRLIEVGQTVRPTVLMIRSIASALGTTVEDITVPFEATEATA